MTEAACTKAEQQQGAQGPERNRWRNLHNVMEARISNLRVELDTLRMQTVAKSNELEGLREALRQIDKFAPPDGTK